MAEAFTVFEKFGDVCATLNEPDRKELIYAINMYGMFGEEVELAYPLNALFAALKDDIDHSKESRKKGSRGGRPKAGEQVSETEKPGVSESENPNAKQVSEIEKPGVSETEKPGVFEDSEKVETQYKTIQSKTKQSNTRESGRRFTPPSPTEVAEYAETRGQPDFPAERFCDFYESKGWRIGSASMKDWKAAVRNWIRTETEHQKAVNDGKVDLNAFSAIPNF